MSLSTYPPASLVLLSSLLLALLALPAQSYLHSYQEEGPLATWAQLTFQNLPPYFWNNIFAGPSIRTFGGIFTPCGDGSPLDPGYQGVSCDTSREHITTIDLSRSSLPPGWPPLRGSLFIKGGAPPIIALPQLQELNLKDNNLSGIIPMELGLSPSLQRLVLGGNMLSGSIPQELCALNLTCLNVSHNSLNGSIPACFQSFPCLDFDGNQDLARGPADCNPNITFSSCDQQALVFQAPATTGGLSAGALAGIMIGALVGVAILLVAFVLVMRHQRRRLHIARLKQLASDVESQISSRHFGTLVRFQEDELSKACSNWNEDYILGEGGYAIVYRGRMEDGMEVAIKRIKKERMKEGAEMEFLNEVEVISRAAHKNLVQCVGFCIDPGQCLALVQHYYSNGTVSSRTAGKEGAPLSWEDRQRIAKGAADGVAYLHTDCNPKLIHRDIKADNILLDDSEEPAVADFGLAAEVDEDMTHKSTDVKGTLGHIAPEYILTGRCSEKTDVYAFGGFLLELVSGRPISDLAALAEAAELLINEWVAQCLEEDKWSELVDTELGPMHMDGPLWKQVKVMLEVALKCMHTDPQDRPDMNEVSNLLVPTEMHEQMGKWQKAQTLGSVPESSGPIDPLQWELDHADLGSDTIGSSLLDSSKFGSSSAGDSQGPF